MYHRADIYTEDTPNNRRNCMDHSDFPDFQVAQAGCRSPRRDEGRRLQAQPGV
jgi:hypothetical protein